MGAFVGANVSSGIRTESDLTRVPHGQEVQDRDRREELSISRTMCLKQT